VPISPRYRLVADELRRRISVGAIAPGGKLPSETDLIREFSLSRGMVREALALLRAEGLVVTRMGRGTFARSAPPVRRLASERYKTERAAAVKATSFTQDHGIAWDDYRLDKEFRQVPAGAEIAELFATEPGTMLLERAFVFHARGVPQQLSRSYLQLATVDGTPVADPDNEPWPGGNTAQLHSLGITVTGVRERVRARMPRHDETELLRIPNGVPVFAITRQTYAGERVVEVAADIVIPADRVELSYWINLED
jgi:GntR family transcriptional regulator